jgi:hypothetical protein
MGCHKCIKLGFRVWGIGYSFCQSGCYFVREIDMSIKITLTLLHTWA